MNPARPRRSGVPAALLTGALAACAGAEADGSPPPLAGFDEPVAWLEEPDDEAARSALDAGGFTGIRVTDARRTLEALVGEPEGLVVAGVVENSPAHAAGVREGDLLLAVLEPEETWLEWPSQWRRIELEARADTELVLVIDRAGLELERRLTVEARVEPAEREPTVRLREDERVGVVLRSATEVEARASGLAPGAGAVVVGLAASSPWRRAGVAYGDLISGVDGRSVDHPQVVLDAIRAAERGAELEFELHRRTAAGEMQSASATLPVSRRAGHVKDVRVPPLYSYRARGERRVRSFVLGAVRWERTPAAWRLRLLWLFDFAGGDTDRLERIE